MPKNHSHLRKARDRRSRMQRTNDEIGRMLDRSRMKIMLEGTSRMEKAKDFEYNPIIVGDVGHHRMTAMEAMSHRMIETVGASMYQPMMRNTFALSEKIPIHKPGFLRTDLMDNLGTLPIRKRFKIEDIVKMHDQNEIPIQFKKNEEEI